MCFKGLTPFPSSALAFSIGSYFQELIVFHSIFQNTREWENHRVCCSLPRASPFVVTKRELSHGPAGLSLGGRGHPRCRHSSKGHCRTKAIAAERQTRQPPWWPIKTRWIQGKNSGAPWAHLLVNQEYLQATGRSKSAAWASGSQGTLVTSNF